MTQAGLHTPLIHRLHKFIHYWNWKCALLSATVRSFVYLLAMVRSGAHGRLAIVLVEIAYVTLTAGLYAGLQQQALWLRPRFLSNMIVVVAIPWLAQALDWMTHVVAGATPPGRATLAVSIFATLSALYHLHIMRRGVFLTGESGHSLLEDFKRIPRLTLGFLMQPLVIAARLGGTEQEAALYPAFADRR